jgi:hypothetical protein
MGTSNFARGNTSKVFAVLMNEEVNFKKCNECGETFYEYSHDLDKVVCCEGATFKEETESRSCESEDYEDFKSNIKERFESLENFIFRENGTMQTNNRNFEGSVIGSLYLKKDKSYLNLELEIQVVVIVRSGYYEGANLDYELNYSINDYKDDNIESVVDEWEYQAEKEYKKGLVTINKPRVESYLESQGQVLVEQVEKIFEEVSTPLNVVASFSNGETIYAKSN